MERWKRSDTSLRDRRDLTPHGEMGEIIRHFIERWEGSDTSRRDGRYLTPHGKIGEI